MDEHLLDILVYCVLTNLVSVVGIVGNFFALFILYPYKLQKAKSLFYGYLTALAASDLFFLFINLVFR